MGGLSAKEFKSVVESCLFRLEKMKWMEKIQGMEKLVLYREIKSFDAGEAYVRQLQR